MLPNEDRVYPALAAGESRRGEWLEHPQVGFPSQVLDLEPRAGLGLSMPNTDSAAGEQPAVSGLQGAHCSAFPADLSRGDAHPPSL